jgi:hypothetical protein
MFVKAGSIDVEKIWFRFFVLALQERIVFDYLVIVVSSLSVFGVLHYGLVLYSWKSRFHFDYEYKS